jgi:hypothetical protein
MPLRHAIDMLCTGLSTAFVDKRKNALRLNSFGARLRPPRLLIRRAAATVTRIFAAPESDASIMFDLCSAPHRT